MTPFSSPGLRGPVADPESTLMPPFTELVRLGRAARSPIFLTFPVFAFFFFFIAASSLCRSLLPVNRGSFMASRIPIPGV